MHAVLLPTTAYLLHLPPPPTRELIDAGAPVAIASDFNPNAHCFDMPTVMNQACVLFNFTMAEALVAATINAASALNIADRCGSLEVGKQADCFLLDAPTWEHLVYQMDPEISDVFKDGISVTKHGTRSPVSSRSLKPPSSKTPLAHQTLTQLEVQFIQELPNGIPTDPFPVNGLPLDESVPHAPPRPAFLNPKQARQAVANALR